MSADDGMTTIEFFDEEQGDRSCVIVRRAGEKVALCISLRSNGDVETFLPPRESAMLIEALQRAMET